MLCQCLRCPSVNDKCPDRSEGTATEHRMTDDNIVDDNITDDNIVDDRMYR